MKTEILLDHERVADGGYVVRALLRITGEAPETEDRPPLNLAVVLDRSGSMAAMGKLERAKEAASLLVRRLADDDVVSVVSYDDEVRTVAGRTPGARRQEVLGGIAGLHPGGTTNLSGGWLRGRELVAEEMVAGKKAAEEPAETTTAAEAAAGERADETAAQELTDGAVNRVLLLTDGLANVGITDPGRLRDLVASAAAKGVTTTTIGFGADYDERLLQALADAGGGSTYYIEEPDQAPAVFEAEIEGLMALAAQNVAVTVAPAAAVEHATVLHQYPRRQTDGGALRLELGDLYALEPKSLLVEFLIEDSAQGKGVAPAGQGLATSRGELDASQGATAVATFTIEGHVLLPNGGVEKRTMTLPVRVSRGEAAVVNPEVRREMLLLEAARAREDALEDRARQAYEAGARKLRRVAEKLAPYAASDDELRDEVDDLRDLAERFDVEQVSTADAKYMYQRAYSRGQSKRAAADRLMEDRALARQRRKRK
jgi:Ca-activated chloride channel family protein